VRVTARTRVFALLGDPVAHSLSPLMQNAAFLAAGIDAVYVVLQPRPDDVASQMATLATGGGGGNITIPYKEIAARAPALRSAQVDRLGSANVFGTTGGELTLVNTDVPAILAALDRLEAPAGAWQVVGTGGSARAVVGAAAERGARVAVRSRDPRRAAEFAAWAASIGVEPAVGAECDVVINATPLGLAPGDPLPADPATLSAHVAILDLVYAPARSTAWVRACIARGLRALDGREVLLAQGAASWDCWFPGLTPPIPIMRAALDGYLG